MDESDNRILLKANEKTSITSRGRPANDRYRFLSGHTQYSSYIVMKWTQPRVPVLLGPMIPRRERDDTKERYCRSVLTLFVPWRSIDDLCDINQSWEAAYISKQNLITAGMRRIIENIQLLHECKKDRDQHLLQIIQQHDASSIDPQLVPQSHLNGNRDDDDNNNVEEIDDILDTLAHLDDISHELYVPEMIINSETVYSNELLTTISKVNRFPCLTDSNGFNNNQNTASSNDTTHYLIPSTYELIKQNKQWQHDLQREKQNVRESILNSLEIDESRRNPNANSADTVVRSISLMDIGNFDIQIEVDHIQSVVKTVVPSISPEAVIEEFTLNENQARAFTIITSHLDGHSFLKRDDAQQQLLMYVPGASGTGKSQLISAATRYFVLTKRSHKLRKLTPTAIAATNINGMTMHSFLKDSRRVSKTKRQSAPGNSSVENQWRHVQYIFIDEISIVGLRLLSRFHEVLTTAKNADPSVPFGGINVVFFGDYIQYSPVLDKPLYSDTFIQSEFSGIHSISKTKKTLTEYEIQCQVGRALVLQITVIVKLTKQIRVEDQEYLEALDRLRVGECTLGDYQLFRSLIVGQSSSIHSLSDISWNTILVHRNEIRTELNKLAVINKCRELNYPPIVCLAQDKVKSKNISVEDFHQLYNFLLSLPDNKTESLPDYLPLVSGMPVLLTDNIATEIVQPKLNLPYFILRE
ncbi:unnamed protein product [Didymodactylos carnosus]|uniref:ATP-dependent DNA helicase n=1 Tax=Didymodactylos carnosus TaxID=1234261 RepID=A0A8S2R3N0_9BILA|nr:unnamed protein product [Didymodactylos carnosus]CAF4143715.1 unnamed protein product [Didymodactylos carnosus]